MNENEILTHLDSLPLDDCGRFVRAAARKYLKRLHEEDQIELYMFHTKGSDSLFHTEEPIAPQTEKHG